MPTLSTGQKPGYNYIDDTTAHNTIKQTTFYTCKHCTRTEGMHALNLLKGQTEPGRYNHSTKTTVCCSHVHLHIENTNLNINKL